MTEILSVHPVEGGMACETAKLCHLGDGIFSASQQFIGQSHALVFDVSGDRHIGDQGEGFSYLGHRALEMIGQCCIAEVLLGKV